jgi:hypothetical protein
MTIKDVTPDLIRKFLEEKKTRMRLDENGKLYIVFPADDNFGHDLYVFFGIGEFWLDVIGKVKEPILPHRRDSAMVAVNSHNRRNPQPVCILDGDHIIFRQSILLCEEVSEDYIMGPVLQAGIFGMVHHFPAMAKYLQPAPEKPIANSFKVMDRVFAGEYPRAKDEQESTDKIQRFCNFGITHFIDLTEEGELLPYSQMLHPLQKHLRFPIPDVSVPASLEEAQQITETIHNILKEDEMNRVYIHCHGGVGRTGTIVGCLYSEASGRSYDEIMYALETVFADCPKSAYRTIPETEEQRQFIAKYAKER